MIDYGNIKLLLKEKNFSKCIDLLRNEIIEILTNKIKKINSNYKYTITRDLWNESKKYLQKEDVDIAYRLYNLGSCEECDEYIISELIEIYSEIKNQI